MNLMKGLPNRLKEYGTLWSSWHIGEEIGSGFGSKIYILTNEKKEVQVLKAITTAFGVEDNDRKQAIKQILQQLEVLNGCSGVNAIEDYEIKEVFDYTGQLAGFDILLRMKRMYSLQRVMEAGIYLEESEVVEMALELAFLLKEAHAKGIIHGNIKPSNIFIQRDENRLPVYYLADFASDRIRGYREGNSIGAIYCSPESATLGVEEEASDDFYSLGLVMYQLLNQNNIPFIEDTKLDLGAAVKKRMASAILPELSGMKSDVDEVVLRCCSLKQYRYHNADEIIEDLRECKVQIGKRQNPKYSVKLEKTKEQRKQMKKLWMKFGAGTAAVFAAGMLISVGVSKWNTRPAAVPPVTTSLAAVSSESAASSSAKVSSQTPEQTVQMTKETTTEATTESTTPAVFEETLTKEEVIQMMLASQETWCQGNYTTPEGIPLANNGIGFIDFDQDGTPEFIHGYAVEPLIGVPVGFWVKYDIYSLKNKTLELIGSLKTLDAKRNTQTGQIVFFNNGYVQGQNMDHTFVSSLEGEASSFVNGKIENTKLFEVKTQREVTAPQETVQYFVYENGQPKEVSAQEYEAAVQTYQALLQPVEQKLSYLDWNPDWPDETKTTALSQTYDAVIAPK